MIRFLSLVLFFNSREAIATIIGDMVVFLQSMNWIGLVLCLLFL